jgi:cytochrome P450
LTTLLEGNTDNITAPVVLKALPLSYDLVVQAANRVLFGTELARNPTWHEVSIAYSTVMFQGADAIRNFPEFMKPFVLRWRTPIHKMRRLAAQCMNPIIRARCKQEASMSPQEWKAKKPQDSLQWVLDAQPASQRDEYDIMLRMLHITVAAVHTTSFTFGESLHCMAAHPEFVPDIRKEIEEVLEKEQAWTVQALNKMKKLDSFITEANRLCVLSSCKSSSGTVRGL